MTEMEETTAKICARKCHAPRKLTGDHDAVVMGSTLLVVTLDSGAEVLLD